MYLTWVKQYVKIPLHKHQLKDWVPVLPVTGVCVMDLVSVNKNLSQQYFTKVRSVRAPQVSTFSFCFLLFFRNDGGLNFFFFLDGDLEGEPSGVPAGGLAGGAAGVEEVSLVVRAFIPSSSSSVIRLSSSLPFWMTVETVLNSSAPEKIQIKKLAGRQNSEDVGATKLSGAADEHACVMSRYQSVSLYLLVRQDQSCVPYESVWDDTEKDRYRRRKHKR